MQNHGPPTHTPLTRQFMAMAFSPSSQQPTAPKPMTNMTVPQLLTPEEPLVEDFERATVLPPIHSVPSPPESPAFRYHAATSEDGYGQHDRILYPETTTTTTTTINTPADRPLFDSNPSYRWASPERHESPALSSAVSSPRSRCDSPFPLSKPPVSPSQSTAGSPVPNKPPVGPVALLNAYGIEYYRYMREQVEGHRALRLAHRTLPLPHSGSRVSGRDAISTQQVSMLSRSHNGNRVEKPRPLLKAAARPKAAAKTATPSPRIESAAAPKRSRRQHLSPEAPAAVGVWQQSPAPKPRTRAAPSKKVDDKDYSEWASIIDYSPPVSSLDDAGKKLTATWNNSNSLSLDNDPDRLHLHPQEYGISSTLRLKCNQYLASKRRIFAAKVKALKDGREFNKTSAQNCCTIDVNKASRLWMAFDGVGWFDDHWFQQYM